MKKIFCGLFSMIFFLLAVNVYGQSIAQLKAKKNEISKNFIMTVCSLAKQIDEDDRFMLTGGLLVNNTEDTFDFELIKLVERDIGMETYPTAIGYVGNFVNGIRKKKVRDAFKNLYFRKQGEKTASSYISIEDCITICNKTKEAKKAIKKKDFDTLRTININELILSKIVNIEKN